MHPPGREIRARFDDRTITVYQAFLPEIAEPAARTGRFGAGFSLDRMTWIKPSFFWMMHRSGWASKSGQERVLAIDITRSGFEWALSRGVLSHFDASLHSSREAWNRDLSQSPVRIQWDPERGRRLELLPWRSLQVGLQGEAASRYVSEWIVSIRNVTDFAHRLRDTAEAAAPRESPYPLSPALAARIGASGA